MEAAMAALICMVAIGPGGYNWTWQDGWLDTREMGRLSQRLDGSVRNRKDIMYLYLLQADGMTAGPRMLARSHILSPRTKEKRGGQRQLSTCQ